MTFKESENADDPNTFHILQKSQEEEIPEKNYLNDLFFLGLHF